MKKSPLSARRGPSKLRFVRLLAAVISGLVLGCAAHPASVRAEAKQIRIAVQFGIGYLPLLVAEDHGLIERRLRDAGLSDTEVTLVRFSGAPPVSEALLSGNVEFGTYGTTGFLTVWSKTRGSLNIKGLCGIAVMQSVVLANRPDIKSVRDFKPEDRISVPATISPQAQILRMATEKAFGPGQYGKLDAQMVTLPHPEGLRALTNRVDVVAQVTSPPFDHIALQDPTIHKVLTSEDVLGGPSTFLILATSEKFARDNPQTTQAVLDAMEEAMRFIKEHRREAAEIYLKAEKSSMTREFVEKVLGDPASGFAIEPIRVMDYAGFMARTNALRQSPQGWKDLFLPLIAGRNGS